MTTTNTVSAFINAGIYRVENATLLASNLDCKDNKKIHAIRVITKQLRAYRIALKPLSPINLLTKYPQHNLNLAAKKISISREKHVCRKLLNKLIIESGDRSLSKPLSELLAAIDEDVPEPVFVNQELIDLFEIENNFWNCLGAISIDGKLDHLQGMKKTFQKAKSLGEKVAKLAYDGDVAHEWRKWTKYFLYQIEIQPLNLEGKNVEKYHARLSELGSMQGKFHDLVMLKEFVLSANPSLISEKELTRVLSCIEEKQITLSYGLSRYNQWVFSV